MRKKGSSSRKSKKYKKPTKKGTKQIPKNVGPKKDTTQNVSQSAPTVQIVNSGTRMRRIKSAKQKINFLVGYFENNDGRIENIKELMGIVQMNEKTVKEFLNYWKNNGDKTIDELQKAILIKVLPENFCLNSRAEQRKQTVNSSKVQHSVVLEQPPTSSVGLDRSARLSARTKKRDAVEAGNEGIHQPTCKKSRQIFTSLLEGPDTNRSTRGPMAPKWFSQKERGKIRNSSEIIEKNQHESMNNDDFVEADEDYTKNRSHNDPVSSHFDSTPIVETATEDTLQENEYVDQFVNYKTYMELYKCYIESCEVNEKTISLLDRCGKFPTIEIPSLLPKAKPFYHSKSGCFWYSPQISSFKENQENLHSRPRFYGIDETDVPKDFGEMITSRNEIYVFGPALSPGKGFIEKTGLTTENPPLQSALQSDEHVHEDIRAKTSKKFKQIKTNSNEPGVNQASELQGLAIERTQSETALSVTNHELSHSEYKSLIPKELSFLAVGKEYSDVNIDFILRLHAYKIFNSEEPEEIWTPTCHWFSQLGRGTTGAEFEANCHQFESWKGETNVLTKKMIIIPVHSGPDSGGGHWTLAVIANPLGAFANPEKDQDQCKILVFDSLGGGVEHCRHIKHVLTYWLKHTGKQENVVGRFNKNRIELVEVMNVPRQTARSNDCGPFVCHFAERVMKSLDKFQRIGRTFDWKTIDDSDSTSNIRQKMIDYVLENSSIPSPKAIATQPDLKMSKEVISTPLFHSNSEVMPIRKDENGSSINRESDNEVSSNNIRSTPSYLSNERSLSPLTSTFPKKAAKQLNLQLTKNQDVDIVNVGEISKKGHQSSKSNPAPQQSKHQCSRKKILTPEKNVEVIIISDDEDEELSGKVSRQIETSSLSSITYRSQNVDKKRTEAKLEKIQPRKITLARQNTLLTLENINKDQCSVNTIANILYSCEDLRDMFTYKYVEKPNKPLSQLFKSIVCHETRSTRAWRNSITNTTKRKGIQDICTMVELLLRPLSREVDLDPIKFDVIYYTKCASCPEPTPYGSVKSECFYNVIIGNDTTFEELFVNEYEKKRTSRCDCGRQSWQRKTIVPHGRYHIILIYHKLIAKKTIGKLIDFNSNKMVEMFDAKWRLRSFAQYVNNNHFQAWVRFDDGWTCVSDEEIKETRVEEVDLSTMCVKMLVFEKI